MHPYACYTSTHISITLSQSAWLLLKLSLLFTECLPKLCALNVCVLNGVFWMAFTLANRFASVNLLNEVLKLTVSVWPAW